MKRVFFSGSISIKKLPDRIKKSVDEIKKIGEFDILVGDAQGFDFLLQTYCHEIGFGRVTVYTVNNTPRNHIPEFKVKKVKAVTNGVSERQRQTFKDKMMTLDSDISYVVWDEKSKGSYNNIIRAIDNNKQVRVFSSLRNEAITNISKENITSIYINNNGLTTSDLLTELHTHLIKEFNTAKELNQYLVSHGYVLLVDNNGKRTYKTCNDKFSFDITHRGYTTGVKFKYSLVKELIDKLKVAKGTTNYSNIRG